MWRTLYEHFGKAQKLLLAKEVTLTESKYMYVYFFVFFFFTTRYKLEGKKKTAAREEDHRNS